MNKMYKDCSPRICGKELLRNDNTFANAETIKTDCSNECCKAVCFEILRLLKEDNWVEAWEMLNHTK